MKYCFVFVCQHGQLEIKSSLLAVSLKRNLKCDFELVAAIPGPEETWGSSGPETMDLFQEIGVRTVGIENLVDSDYPIGNKVSCLGVETDADKIIFLDSDILCCSEFSGHERFSVPFNAKPVDVNTFTYDVGVWDYIYQKFGLPIQSQRVITTVSYELVPPYFNAGMIAVDNDPAFMDLWVDVCRQIDADPAIQNKRPWLDQVALPIAVALSGKEYDCLDERFNYPAHVKPISPGSTPYFCHYHVPQVIRREPLLNNLCEALLDEYPGIRKQLSGFENWSLLARPFAIGSKDAAPNASKRREQHSPLADGIVTGIPRSGTSYLCTLLNKTGCAVAINEPTDIFQPLAAQQHPWGVGVYHRNVRQFVLDGQPVQNKMKDGVPVEDTDLADAQGLFTPDVKTMDFALFTKNTIAYLARIKELRKVFPQAPFVACIRNPYDAIASWKASSPHLRDADVTNLPIGNPKDPFMSSIEIVALRRIASTQSAAIRRALLWRFLAGEILENINQLTLVHYESLVTDPGSVVSGILREFDGDDINAADFNFEPSEIRSKRDLLDDEDMLAIRSICGDVAYELGYEIDGSRL